MTEQEAVIDFDRLNRLSESVPTPIVIHGSSGIPDDQISKMRFCGVGKMNIGTALRMSFGHTIREFTNENPDVFDRIEIFQKPMEAMKDVIRDKYKQLGW